MTRQYLRKIGKLLKKRLSEKELNEWGKTIKFSHRDRTLAPYRLALAFMEVLSCSKVESIADRQRGFNALFGVDVHYKPFPNQRVKPQFSEFMRQRFIQRLEPLACDALAFNKVSPFARFRRIVLQEGTSFAVPPAMRENYPGRFHTVNPAAVERHVALELLTESVEPVVLTAETESEPQFLPEPEGLADCLVLGDIPVIVENACFLVFRRSHYPHERDRPYSGSKNGIRNTAQTVP